MRTREVLSQEEDETSEEQVSRKKPKLYPVFCAAKPQKPYRLGTHLDGGQEQASRKLPSVSALLGHERQGPDSEDVRDEDKARKLKPYSIFCRPTKTVYLVRHGHTWLKKYAEPCSSVMERSMFDIPLTKLGVQQAVALGERLGGLKAEVIICSPLTRALETLQCALPSLPSARFEICPIHTESLQVSGDVGRSPDHLAKEFPWASFRGLEPVWWYSHPQAANDSGRGLFQRREPIENVMSRIGMFRRLLCARSEAVIVVVGHSSFFMRFLGADKRLRNCEWTKIRL